jgi:THO complex subunit 2
MQEQERVANEEAEKRLKAALTAKREPAMTSRIASPSIGNSTTANDVSDVSAEATAVTENNTSEDVTMDNDANATVPSAEVRGNP